jgi:serine protease AprX
MLRNYVIILLALSIVIEAHAQRRALVFASFINKDTTVYKLSCPEAFFTQTALARKQKHGVKPDLYDIPVNWTYIDSLNAMGYHVIGVSKWLNGALLETHTMRSLDSIKNIGFIADACYLGTRNLMRSSREISIPDIEKQLAKLDKKVTGTNRLTDSGYYGNATMQIKQLNLDTLHRLGFSGKGVHIAVFDAGFSNLEMINRYQRTFDKARFNGSRNFIDPSKSVYITDDHGFIVVSCMATYMPGIHVGASPEASYYLFVTEDAKVEIPAEEIFWAIAAEFSDSVGADIISSSLGYNEFDEEFLNYTYRDLDGKTTFISKAAKLAVQKGMIVVTSAGNEGDKKWKYISAPSDVEEVIAVGGVDVMGRMAMFSSQGPTADKRVKPDVVATGEGTYTVSPAGVVYRSNGTSYAAPLVSGMIACLLQAFPNTTPAQMQAIIRLSSDRYYMADNHFGYGVPNSLLAFKMLEALFDETPADKIIDFDLLGNKYFHLTVYCASPNQFRWRVEDKMGKIMASGSQKVREAGVQRVQVVKKKKLPKGNYVLKVDTRDKVFNSPFNVLVEVN